ncbi:MAG: hypothetical protein ABJP34_10675 [Erythrobacter sp.]
MTRQWLALIALLTGLAAVGAPVNAQAAQALSCEIGASATVSSDAAAGNSSAHRPKFSSAKFAAALPQFELLHVQRFAPKTVLIEVDRAHK